MDAAEPIPEQPSSWTVRTRRAIDRHLPMDHLLPDRQPYYIGSWVYVFGVVTIAALGWVIVSGVVLSFFGPQWWHDSSVGRFFNSLHFWSVQLFFIFMVLHLWGQYFMAGWRHGRAATWMIGVVIFGISILTAFTGYLTQQKYYRGVRMVPYDLVKELAIALGVVGLLTVVLAGLLSSPDVPPVTIATWSQTDPVDFVTTATGELAGTTGSAGYGQPYNSTPDAYQRWGPIAPQAWFGVRIPVDSASAFVIEPLMRASVGNTALGTALSQLQ